MNTYDLSLTNYDNDGLFYWKYCERTPLKYQLDIQPTWSKNMNNDVVIEENTLLLDVKEQDGIILFQNTLKVV